MGILAKSWNKITKKWQVDKKDTKILAYVSSHKFRLATLVDLNWKTKFLTLQFLTFQLFNLRSGIVLRLWERHFICGLWKGHNMQWSAFVERKKPIERNIAQSRKSVVWKQNFFGPLRKILSHATIFVECFYNQQSRCRINK